MTAAETLRNCLGDPARFQRLRERVEIVFDEQLNTWVEGNSGWLVLPLDRTPQAFYLLSEDREGQRRGREVLEAFLGPTASVNSVVPDPTVHQTDRLLELAGLRHISQVHRQDGTPGELLARIEDAIATQQGKDARQRPVRPSHVDLLRDLRLALLQRNGRLADRLLEDIRLTGRLSAENLRFLTIEILGRLERWRELHDLPHLPELLRSRRPRVVNEILLEMVWHTEISDAINAGRSPQDVFEAIDLGSHYGSLISAVDVPSTTAGRGVGLIAALVLGDQDRVRRIVLAATDDMERDRLNRLIALEEGLDEGRSAGITEVPDNIRDLFEEGRYGAFIRAFLDAPTPDLADLAIQATLDSEDLSHASDVLGAVKEFNADGRLQRSRRLLRDLEDLDRLVNGSCADWREWSERLARDIRWPDAANVARAQSDQWDDVSSLSGEAAAVASTALLEAWTGVNQDQIVASLDVLCRVAADEAGTGGSNEFCDAVLLLLAEQTNLSTPVRDTYLLLLERILDSGPAESRYREAADLTLKLWDQVAATSSVDWGIALIDAFLNAPAPNPHLRMPVITAILNKSQTYQRRLSIRQRTELAALGTECGVPVAIPDRQADEPESPWHGLDGKTIGLYSLMPGAAESLQRRLAMLCRPRSVESNSDTVATAALKSLAVRADVLVVDTWHAAHAATNAIDSVRPRDRQIFPAGRGVSAFLQALERVVTA